VGDLREEQRAEQEHQQQLHSWQHGSPVFFTLFGINYPLVLFFSIGFLALTTLESQVFIQLFVFSNE